MNDLKSYMAYTSSPAAAATAVTEKYKQRIAELECVIAETNIYRKDGESPAECIARNRADTDGLLTLLAAARVKSEELERENAGLAGDVTRLKLALNASENGTADCLAIIEKQAAQITDTRTIIDAFVKENAELRREIDNMPSTYATPVKELGVRLADLLCGDAWNNIEPILHQIGRQFEELRRNAERYRMSKTMEGQATVIKCLKEFGAAHLDAFIDTLIDDAMKEAKP